MGKRLTAEEVRTAARGHVATHRQVWIDALVVAELATFVKRVKKRAALALDALPDIGSALSGFDLDVDGPSATVRIQVGKSPVQLIFGMTDADAGVWEVFPDTEKASRRAVARKALTHSAP